MVKAEAECMKCAGGAIDGRWYPCFYPFFPSPVSVYLPSSHTLRRLSCPHGYKLPFCSSPSPERLTPARPSPSPAITHSSEYFCRVFSLCSLNVKTEWTMLYEREEEDLVKEILHYVIYFCFYPWCILSAIQCVDVDCYMAFRIVLQVWFSICLTYAVWKRRGRFSTGNLTLCYILLLLPIMYTFLQVIV